MKIDRTFPHLYGVLFILLSGLFIALCSSCQKANNLWQAKENASNATTSPFSSRLTRAPIFTPSWTRLITSQATNTPIPIPSHVELPEWIKDPAFHDVLLTVFPIKEWEYRLSLLNITTLERFDFPMEEPLGFFWIDYFHIGYITKNDHRLLIVDLTNGNIDQKPLYENALQYLTFHGSENRIDPLGMELVGSPLADPDYLLFLNNDGNLSPHKRYYYIRDENNFGLPYAYVDLEDGKRTEISLQWGDDKPHSQNVLDIAWSPTEEKIVAMILGKLPDNSNGNYNGDTLAIVDINNGHVLHSYLQRDIASVHWSPDGKKLLLEAGYDYRGELRSILNPPAYIIDVNGEKTVSLEKINNMFITHAHMEESLGLFQWSTNGKQILFAYDSRDYKQGNEYNQSSICGYSIMNGNVRCLTDNITEIQGFNIMDFMPSSDGRHYLITYGQNLPFYAYWGDYLGVMSPDGSDFHKILEDAVGALSLNEMLWRPKS